MANAQLSKRRALERFVDHERVQGFNTWKLMAAERRQAMRAMSKSLAYMLNRGLAAGMASWRSTWSEMTATRNAMGQSLSHMLNRALSRGWTAWVEMATESAEATQMLRRGGSFLVNRQLLFGLSSWRTACRATSSNIPWLAMMSQMHKLLDCLAKKPGSHVWDAVLQQALGGWASRATDFFATQALNRCWKEWLEYASGRAHRQDAMQSAQRNGYRLHLRCSWYAWSEEAAVRMTLLQLVEEALFGSLERRLAHAFAAWRLELWNSALTAAVSKLEPPLLTPRKPVGTALSPWVEENPVESPRWFGGLVRPEHEPRRPPLNKDRNAGPRAKRSLPTPKKGFRPRARVPGSPRRAM
jgi:hypothetical protein